MFLYACLFSFRWCVFFLCVAKCIRLRPWGQPRSQHYPNRKVREQKRAVGRSYVSSGPKPGSCDASPREGTVRAVHGRQRKILDNRWCLEAARHNFSGPSGPEPDLWRENAKPSRKMTFAEGSLKRQPHSIIDTQTCCSVRTLTDVFHQQWSSDWPTMGPLSNRGTYRCDTRTQRPIKQTWT